MISQPEACVHETPNVERCAVRLQHDVFLFFLGCPHTYSILLRVLHAMSTWLLYIYIYFQQLKVVICLFSHTTTGRMGRARRQLNFTTCAFRGSRNPHTSGHIEGGKGKTGECK